MTSKRRIDVMHESGLTRGGGGGGSRKFRSDMQKIIFCHYQQQSVVNRKKTLKCKVRQTCDVTMTLMTSHVGDVIVKMLEDRCGRCTLSGFKCYSTSAIIVKFSDNICT